MKKLILLAILALVSTTVFADEHVPGYFRKDGTYVSPYHRTVPNDTPYDNYSTKGNTNPYTGQPGTVNPDRRHNRGSQSVNPWNN